MQIKAVFELRALSISGYMPNILACANCGTYETPVMYFDVDGGCIYCEHCPKAGAVAVPKTVMTAVRYICLTEPGRIFGFALSPEQMALLEPSDGAVHPAAAGPALYHTGILQVPASRGRDYITS